MKKNILLLAVLLFQSIVQAQTPIASYPFNGNADDVIGANHGSVNGATLTTDRFGNANSAYSFDGVDDRINATFATTVTDNFTVHGWAKINAIGGTQMLFYHGNSFANGWGLLVNGTGHVSTLYGAVVLSPTTFQLSVNTWYHFALTRTAGTTKVYVNGTEVFSAALASPATPTGLFCMGNMSAGGDFLNGSLDEVKVHNTALTATQIHQEYTNEIALPFPIISGGTNGLCSSSNQNTSHGGDASGFGCGGGGAGYWGGHGGSGLFGGGGGGAAGFNLPNRIGGNGGNGAVVVAYYNVSGTLIESKIINTGNSFTVPLNASTVRVWAVGAGGGGAGATNIDGTSGGGGGAGGTAFKTFTNIPGSIINYTLGVGGSGGIDAANGQAGGSTIVTLSSTTLVASGGDGGQYNSGVDATGGTFSGGDAGANGGNGKGTSGDSGGGAGGGIGGSYNASVTCAGGVGANSINVQNLFNVINHQPVAYKTGSGNAINFDGSNDQIDLATSFNQQVFTIDMWVKPGATQNMFANLIDNNHAGSSTNWTCQQDVNNTNVYGFGAMNTGASFTLTPNQWQHVTLVKGDTAIQTYVNGILSQSTPYAAGPINYNGNFLRLGNWGGGGRNWNGQMDEVRIWNVALTQTQIRDRMCHKISELDTASSDLIAYYNFDEDDGNTVVDGSNSTNHGTLVNNPARVKSGAAIGDQSMGLYGGAGMTNFSYFILMNTLSIDISYAQTSNNAMQIYDINELPEDTAGLNIPSGTNGYFGVFPINIPDSAFTIKYDYRGFLGSPVSNDSAHKLIYKNDNAASQWVNSNAILNTNLDILTATGKKGEYILAQSVPPTPTTFTLRSGNGSVGQTDAQVKMLVGPADNVFTTTFNSSDFISARNGPPALIMPNNPSWIPTLNADPVAKWINNTGSNGDGSTCLYAHDFYLGNPFDSASIDFYYAIDNLLGGGPNEGIYLNGQALSGSTTGGTYSGQFHFFRNDIAPLLQQGLNTLYVNASDLGGPGGIIFSATINTNCNQQTWYQDADGDGYGSASISQSGCGQPTGFVANNTDCDDTDSVEHPNQVWHIDQDDDDYGTGATVTQCLRPAHGYRFYELASVTGDCNDSNPLINPASQYYTLSGSTNFTNHVIFPLSGTSYTNFQFEIMYYDATGALPPVTFPRVYLDYEGNGIYNNPNDRAIVMTAFDVSDNNTADGKKYVGSINTLPNGTNWETSIQITNGSCQTIAGPYNFPDVLVQPDLQIFANDISFNQNNPQVNSPLTVSAVIQNVSDFAAQNFVVHLVNQAALSTNYPDIIVANLAPHSATTVSWDITTPLTPIWCPMQVSVDYTNLIAETNELDNTAVRPFTNGNFIVPGSIVLTTSVSPAVSLSSANNTLYLQGTAHYSGLAIQLADSSLAGAEISFYIIETGASFIGYTDAQGYINASFPAPVGAGSYHIGGQITDFTLTGTIDPSTGFTILPVCKPDLTATLTVSSGNIIEGQSVTGNILVQNLGCAATTGNTLLKINQGGGSPSLNDIVVPPLLPGGSFSIPIGPTTYNTAGTFGICATADGDFIVEESNETNNISCVNIQVLPALPDIAITVGPGSSLYNCNGTVGLYVELKNFGGAATGFFHCQLIVKQGNTTIQTFNQSFNNLAIGETSFIAKLFNVPSNGNYEVQVICDNTNIVTEVDDVFNNNALYNISILPCKPDLITGDCEQIDVQSADGTYTGMMTLSATIINIGNANATGPIPVRFEYSNGSIFVTSYNGNLAVNQSAVVSMTVPAIISTTNTMSAHVDFSNAISELQEGNNVSESKHTAWEFYPVANVYPCGVNFWDQGYLVNHAVYLSCALRAQELFDADTLDVKFEVSGPGLPGTINLGNAMLYQMEQTCGFCPRVVSLPTNFVFPQVGTYTFTMTVDPENKFTETNEGNNVLVVTVLATDLPDMRTLSQFINPSLLNPQVGQNINMTLTYENIGASNINDQMEFKLLVDNVPLDSIYPVSGLITGDNATFNFSVPWSSNIPGAHIIRAIIDNDDQVVESANNNNEATRAVIVGASANLYVKSLFTLNAYPELFDLATIKAKIGNAGDLVCQGDVSFYFVDKSLDTVLITTQHVTVNGQDSISLNVPWIVIDNKTTIVVKITNSSILEFDYSDNTAFFELGKMDMIITALPACATGSTIGSLTANILGGEPPYNYSWSNGFSGQTLLAPVGTYSVTVSDQTGQLVTGSEYIFPCPAIVNLKAYMQGYYVDNGQMQPVLQNQGVLSVPSHTDSIDVELREAAPGHALAASYRGVLHRDGTMPCYYPLPLIGNSYYLVVKHRNLVETWSANPIVLAEITSYDFTTSSDKAYGDNQVEVENGIWALYTGDINHDENVDLLDLPLVEVDINNFAFGYFATDINGDGNVDLLDNPLLEENISNFVFSNHP